MQKKTNFLDIKNIIKNLYQKPTSLHSVDESSLGWLLYCVLNGKKDETLIAIVPDLKIQEDIISEIENLKRTFDFQPKILTIPECNRGKVLFPGGENARARALHEALTKEYDLVIGSVHSLYASAPMPNETKNAELNLEVGMTIPMSELLEKLVQLDYDDEYEAVVSGEFARRGGIIDVYSPAFDYPCRIEFFGDTIESLRKYDVATQRSIGSIEAYQIIGRSGITAGGEHKSDIFHYFENSNHSIIDIFPSDNEENLKRFENENKYNRLKELYKKENIIQWHKLENIDCQKSFIEEAVPAISLFYEDEEMDVYDSNISIQKKQTLQKEFIFEFFKQKLSEGFKFLFCAPHKEMLPDFKKWINIDNDNIYFTVLPISIGVCLPTEKIIILPESQLACLSVGKQILQIENNSAKEDKVPTVKNQPKTIVAELEQGDYAVHIDYGVCLFKGIRKLDTQGSSREVMVLEFNDEKLIYVPLLQAYKVSRYLGGSASSVKLHTIGRKRWQQDKSNAKDGIRSYAAEMLRLQAIRAANPGIAFPKDKDENIAFRLAFPYKDTPDQEKATSEIIADMQSERPMDRLLCGDVGYGKTEVAMRAIEKAVSSGYQVALLAPTTLLAQQHYYSFCERFAPYPYTINLLSRMVSTKEQNKTIENLKNGGVDIVIGTHRLCSLSISFKNLGLVVIDEEQRFGTRHKDMLRRLRTEVDVLSMSATPIPRTLYLAMAGGRDLSTLMTAPKLRLPVKTAVVPEDDTLVYNAINAELARGGQIYYIHNRVKTIEKRTLELQALLPEAKIAFAHGQMDEEQLEFVMNNFLDGKIDCLVCSTIVESGLDVPNANTIIIERADRFGIAELYQLRGRVGRWKHQAYAYMMLPKNQLISTNAQKRLSAIRRCSSLGANFQLALRDLEIRGAGNLLGKEQSGHLNLIGFELYCELLRQELANLKGEEIAKPIIDVEISIDFISFYSEKVSNTNKMYAFLSKEYIGAEKLRLDAYRTLGKISSIEQLNNYSEMLSDRFGKLTVEASNLIEFIRIKILTANANIDYLALINGKLLLRYKGTISPIKINNKIPQIDYRNSLPMRMLHLKTILEEILKKNGSF